MTSTRKAGPFIAFMLALTVLFVALGFWQLQRLVWKDQLIAAVEDRARLSPAALAPAALWRGLVPDAYDFTSVSLTGTFVAEQPVLVFTSLSEPRGALGGLGYWVMQLFALEGGGRVWANRGFVPEDRLGAFGPPPAGPVTLTGLMRRPESANWFSPAADSAARRDYIRDPARFPAPGGVPNAVVAPFTVDLASMVGERLPQAGETVMEFPNRHFEYALTWFALAALASLLLAVWLRQRRVEPASLAPLDPRD
ncbi:MAG: SURF1 family cytochrome oxidase biogenesis protein [Cucumibacter sp.]